MDSKVEEEFSEFDGGDSFQRLDGGHGRNIR